MILALKLLIVSLFVFFYTCGGQGTKWLKSWVAPIILSLGVLLTTFLDHKLGVLTTLGAFLYLVASNSFSYGVKFTHDKLWLKVLFRGLCGASNGVCGLLVGIGCGHWALGALQLVLAILGSVLFGVFSPFPESWRDWKTRAEDICISGSYVCLLPFIL